MTENIFIEDINQNVAISRSSRRTLAIMINPAGTVEVRSPKRASLRSIKSVILSKKNWILDKLDFIHKNPRAVFKEPLLVSGDEFYFLGKKLKLILVRSQFQKIITTDEHLLFYSKDPNNFKQNKRYLKNWFTENSDLVFRQRFDLYCNSYHIQGVQLKLKNMKACWGKCYPKEKLILLTKELITQPINYIDGVIIHELCHLTHFNHDKNFYELLSQRDPTHKSLKKDLELIPKGFISWLNDLT